ncbi:VOC family protein [Actinoplanes sp. NPDC026619]|uniref:VOC family protein n=1 Tax=Actinoplanes sp. NPDC026619 TaxID=3155798 RepID=UPI0033C0044C
MTTYPRIRQVVLDSTDARRLAEFYRQMFGLDYRPGDEPPAPGEPDENGQDWLVLQDPSGSVSLAFQQTEPFPHTTWPEPGVPQQYHLDTSVDSVAELDAQHERALALGATLRFDRSDDKEEPLRVYADVDGHLFCVFVA